MGFELLWLFRYLELDCDTDAYVNLTVSTDKPGDVIVSKRGLSFSTETTTTGRRTVRVVFPGTAKGRLLRVRIEPLGVLRIYGARVWAKALGGRATWAWYALPVIPTPDLYASAPIPIAGVQDLFSAAPIPIDPTPEEFAAAPIPIAGVQDLFSAAPLPIDGTPEEYASAALPIDGTREDWNTVTVPIAETPVEGVWVDLPAGDQMRRGSGIHLELPAGTRPEDMERVLNERLRKIASLLRDLQPATAGTPSPSGPGGTGGTGGGATGGGGFAAGSLLHVRYLITDDPHGIGVAVSPPPALLILEIEQDAIGYHEVFFGAEFPDGPYPEGVSKAAGTKTTILFHASEDGLSWLQAAPMQIK